MRDLDILLNKILDDANDVPLSSDQVDDDYSYTHKEMGVFALIMDIFKDLQKLLQISEVWLATIKYILAHIFKYVFLGAFHVNCSADHRYRVDCA